MHPVPQASPTTNGPPPTTTGNVQNFHGTRSSVQQQDSEQKIRSSKLPCCCRTPEPAADAQRRRRCRHRRLARTVHAEFRATSRPPVVPGWRQRLPRESPTLSGTSLGRVVFLAAPNAAPCLLLLDASPLPLDLVVGLWLLQYIPYKSCHKTQFTHTHPHTPGHPLASTYDNTRATPDTRSSPRLTSARNTSAEASFHQPAHRTYPNEGGPIGCTARKGGTPYTIFTLPA